MTSFIKVLCVDDNPLMAEALQEKARRTLSLVAQGTQEAP